MLTTEPQPGIMLYSFATAQADEVYREVRKASSAGLDAFFIAGGPHPSARPAEVLEHFDYVVIGEGEETLPELLRAIRAGEDPLSVPGIAYKRDGAFTFTGKRAPVDLDMYPPFEPPIFSPIEISRGCPWGCAFCQTPSLFGRKMRHRSVPVILRYAQFYSDLRFTSPNALAYGSDGRTPRLDKLELLLRSLSKLGKRIFLGTFPSEVRPEFVSERALELILDFCYNRVLGIGGQSGSKRVLEAVGRGHGVEEIETACDLCLEYGVTPNLDLIFGLPIELEDDQIETMELAQRVINKGGRVRAHYFTPLPGTPLESFAPAPLSLSVAKELGRLALEGKLTGRWA
jgi:B12-binding domain/radical SAM domain protein